MEISFLGAANMVTGSNYLISTDHYKILLDCGQFQGSKEIEKLNRVSFPFNPEEIDFILLSHAHIDHSGRIPKLVKEGFKGKIFCTRATADLADILLRDSGHIHEMETIWENRKRLRTGLDPIEPLYTVTDAENSMQYFNPVLYDQVVKVNESIRLCFRDAGHILGSSIIELWIQENEKELKIVFSGDLGLKNKPLLKDPSYIKEADYLIIESTYGNRVHENIHNRINQLVNIVHKTIKNGGTVVIPSFAVGRTQELIYEFNRFYDYREKYKDFLWVPVYIDSPLAISATEIFRKHADCFDEEAKEYILKGDNPLDFYNLHFTLTTEESKKLNASEEPKIILSASGMCEAGRIKHHLKHHLWEKNSSIVFVGYQAEGSLGRTIKDGAKTVKIFGEKIVVQAEIYTIEGFSGHADKNGLLDWIRGFEKKPKKIFVVHGEADATSNLAHLIKNEFQIDTIVPNLYDQFNLSNDEIIEHPMSHKISKDQKYELFIDVHTLSHDFLHALELTNHLIQSDLISIDEYHEIKNKLLHLEKEMIDFNMLLGDKKYKKYF